MRVSTLMFYNQSTNYINKHYEDMYRVNEQLSSGKKINRPSDDPIGCSKVLNYRNVLSSLEQYSANCDTAATWLENTESALSQVTDLLTSAKTLATQMATDSYNEDEREALAVQAEELYDQLLQIANTEINGKYIFSGYRTGTQPFTRDDNYTVSYHGDANSIQIAVQQNQKATINVTGQDAFMEDVNVFDVLQNLRTALAENDTEAIGEVSEEINEAQNQISKVRAYVGVSLQQIESTQATLEDITLVTTDLLSSLEDTDLVDATTQLATLQVAMEASLQLTAAISDLSLLNYV